MTSRERRLDRLAQPSEQGRARERRHAWSSGPDLTTRRIPQPFEDHARLAHDHPRGKVGQGFVARELVDGRQTPQECSKIRLIRRVHRACRSRYASLP
jgi:hypothetical protein